MHVLGISPSSALLSSGRFVASTFQWSSAPSGSALQQGFAVAGRNTMAAWLDEASCFFVKYKTRQICFFPTLTPYPNTFFLL